MPFAKRGGYLARAVRPGNFSAVTGACQMFRRDVFEQVGDYNEELAVGFNDADFCLRVWEAGYRTIFTPYAELYHYEFTSRGREETNEENCATGSANRHCSCSAGRSSSWMAIPGSDRTYPPTVSTPRFSAK